MNIIEDKKGISKKEMFSNRNRFRLGDEVGIPVKLFEGQISQESGFVEAVVHQICTHHIVFKIKKTGFMRSFQLCDCQNIFIIKESKYEIADTDVTLKDVLNEMNKKERH